MPWAPIISPSFADASQTIVQVAIARRRLCTIRARDLHLLVRLAQPFAQPGQESPGEADEGNGLRYAGRDGTKGAGELHRPTTCRNPARVRATERALVVFGRRRELHRAVVTLASVPGMHHISKNFISERRLS